MQTVGHIAEVWRYPVKSMAGERVEAAAVTAAGLPGDRAWAVRDEAAGELTGGKKLPALMRCAAHYPEAPTAGAVQPAEIVLPDGRCVRTDSPDAARLLSELTGRDVTVWPLQPASDKAHYRFAKEFKLRDYRKILGLREGEPFPDVSPMSLKILHDLTTYVTPPGTYFDAYPLHLLTTASLGAMARQAPEADFDRRRFRPNLLIETPATADDLAEFGWCGGFLEIGETRLRVEVRTVRCAMPAHPQPDLAKDGGVVRAVAEHADRHLGVYATVLRPGTVRVGDVVRFQPAVRSRPHELAREVGANIKRGLFHVVRMLNE